MEWEEYKEIVRTWIKDLSASVGEELTLDDEGICSFRIEGETIISLEVSSDFPVLYIYSPLLALPNESLEQRNAMLAKALEINAFQGLTRGGSIALVPGGNILFYCFTQSIEGVDSINFDEILGAFYETALELKALFHEPEDHDKEELFRMTA